MIETAATRKDLICQKCLTSRTGDVLGEPCRTPGCDGVMEESPVFSTLVDDLPEPMMCGRRGESPLANRIYPGPDHWQKFKSNGNRVCSYCGSLHPDDLFVLVRECANAPADAAYNSVPEIEPSDKGYKIYVNQPGVRNAMEGGIKFYTHHLPRDSEGKLRVTAEQEDEYARAVRATKARFEQYLTGIRLR
jgi:hypothetical protein